MLEYTFSLGGDTLFKIHEYSKEYLNYRVNTIYDRLRTVLSEPGVTDIKAVKFKNYAGIYCNNKLLVTLTDKDAQVANVRLDDLIFKTLLDIRKLDFHKPVYSI